MSAFVKRIFWGVMIGLFLTNVSFSHAANGDCVENGIQRPNGGSACFNKNDPLTAQFGVCENGTFRKTPCGITKQCVDINATTSNCISAEEKKTCTRDSVTRNLNETACFNNNIYMCASDFPNPTFKLQKTCPAGCDSPDRPKDCKLPDNACECDQSGKITKNLCTFEFYPTCDKDKCECKKQQAEFLNNSCVCKSNKITENKCVTNYEAVCVKSEECQCKPLYDGTCTCDSNGVVTRNGCDIARNEQKFSAPVCDVNNKTCQCMDMTAQGTNAFCVNRGPGTSDPAIDTALGCIPIEMGSFMKWLLPWIFGVAGGISFLLMVYGFILMATSKGDPKAIQGAKETITSAVTGLLVSVFSLFILWLIVVDILKIPGISTQLPTK